MKYIIQHASLAIIYLKYRHYCSFSVYQTIVVLLFFYAPFHISSYEKNLYQILRIIFNNLDWVFCKFIFVASTWKKTIKVFESSVK